MSEIRVRRTDGTVIVLGPGDVIEVDPQTNWLVIELTADQVKHLIMRQGSE